MLNDLEPDLEDYESQEEIDRKFRMYFKCEDEKKEVKEKKEQEGHEKEVCSMKESLLWKEVFEAIKF